MKINPKEEGSERQERSLHKASAPDSDPAEFMIGEETLASINSIELRLLMKEREVEAARLMDLDFRIWAIEESFRTKVPKRRG